MGAGCYRMLDVQAALIGLKTPDQVQVDQMVREGDTVRWGGCEAQILHTPGHTPGSICLYLPGVTSQAGQPGNAAAHAANGTGKLFAGDTLFAGSIGRTDLWGGSFDAIIRSIKGKLLELPDDTTVYPGHGDPTTIGQERETNPFLLGN